MHAVDVEKAAPMSRITHIELDDANLPPPTPEIEQERKVAMFDLLEDNSFVLPNREDRDVPAGPYRLGLSIRDKRLVFDVTTEDGEKAAEFHLSLGPFRQVVKDYFQICESYFEAVKTLPPSQIETIDMARRGIHNEGSRVLAGASGGQGRDRQRHRPPPLHPDLRAAFRRIDGQPIFRNRFCSAAITTPSGRRWRRGS